MRTRFSASSASPRRPGSGAASGCSAGFGSISKTSRRWGFKSERKKEASLIGGWNWSSSSSSLSPSTSLSTTAQTRDQHFSVSPLNSSSSSLHPFPLSLPRSLPLSPSLPLSLPLFSLPRLTVKYIVVFFVASLLNFVPLTLGNCPVLPPCKCETNPSTNKTYIYCKRLNLIKVPNFMLSFTAYDELVLSENVITDIPNWAFINIRVKAIKLDGNPIKNVTKNAFMGLEEILEELHISMDRVPSLPADSWATLKRLKVLDLSGFRLERLTPSAFSKLTELVDLRVAKSAVRSVDPLAFEGLERSLRRLSLKENLLNRVPTSALSRLSHLENLTLDTNLIIEINNEAFAGLTRLKFVSLWFNQMQRITDRAFQGLEYSLIHLGLQYNKLQNDDVLAIGKLKHLEELKLGFNQVSSFPYNMFKNMVHLKYLNLEQNHVEVLSNETFRGLEGSLETLIISKNKLYDIQGSPFKRFFKLKRLFIDQNDKPNKAPPGAELRFTLETIKGLEFNLETLSLQAMRLQSSDLLAIGKLRMLKGLHLCENHIGIIPFGVFKELKHLKVLDLCHNKIRRVNATAFQGLRDSLEKLDLQSNDITTFHECSLHGFHRIETINLKDNQLNCDCRLAWLRERMDYGSTEFRIAAREWQCQKPAEFQGRTLYTMTYSDFVCTDPVVKHDCTEFTWPPLSGASTTTTRTTGDDDDDDDSGVTLAPGDGRDGAGDTATVTVPTSLTTVPTANDRTFHIKMTDVTPRRVTVQWVVGSDEDVDSFRVQHRLFKNDTYMTSPKLHNRIRKYHIQPLKEDSDYIVCVVLRQVSTRHEKKRCTDVSTTSITSTHTGPTDQETTAEGETALYIVVGLSTGIAAILLLTAIFYVAKRSCFYDEKPLNYQIRPVLETKMFTKSPVSHAYPKSFRGAPHLGHAGHLGGATTPGLAHAGAHGVTAPQFVAARGVNGHDLICVKEEMQNGVNLYSGAHFHCGAHEGEEFLHPLQPGNGAVGGGTLLRSSMAGDACPTVTLAKSVPPKNRRASSGEAKNPQENKRLYEPVVYEEVV